jgi:uncharacterized protein
LHDRRAAGRVARGAVASKVAQRLAQARLTPQGIVDDLRRIAVVVSPIDTPRVVPSDPDDDHVIVVGVTGHDDDHVIAAAVSGQVDLIASGDKRDLLILGRFQGIDIVTAREAVERLEATGKT